MTDSASHAATGRSPSVDVELQGLTVQAGSRILLQDTSARFAAGQVTLIVGRSGVGKSTLLKVIAGLLDDREEGIRVTGAVRLCDEAGHPLQRRQSVGVVFQDYALFDELSPLQNVRLARAHRPRRAGHDGMLEPDRLLEELGVPTDVPTHALSGGQRQRLAIARTLAYEPEVVLYDEPTSGLDSATAAEVTRVIAATHANHACTSLIVTHDYESLSRIADAIYLIDPDSCTLRPVPRDEWDNLSALLERSGSASDELLQVEVSRLPKWMRRAQPMDCRRAGRDVPHVGSVPPAPLAAGTCLEESAVGTAFLLALPAHRGESVSLGVYRDCRGDHRLRGDVFHVSIPAQCELHQAAGDRGSAAIDGICPLSHPGPDSGHDPDCGSLWGGGGVGCRRQTLRPTDGRSPHARCGTETLLADRDPLRIPARDALVAGYRVCVRRADQSGRLHRDTPGPRSVVLATAFPPGTGGSRSVVLCRKSLAAGQDDRLLGGNRADRLLARARPKDSSRAVSQGVTSTILWSTLYVLAVHFVFAFVEFR